MVRWESDTCPNCVWEMEPIGEEWVGHQVVLCTKHETLDEALSINRFKNIVIATICDALNIDPVEAININQSKNISFTILDDGDLVFHITNFTPEEVAIISRLVIDSPHILSLDIRTT
jgi:hypothetical protein